MTEIDKRNLKNYLCFTFGITYIVWGLLALFTQSDIFGLETIIGRMLHIAGPSAPTICNILPINVSNPKI